MASSVPVEDRTTKRQRLLALLESDDKSAASAAAAAAASATVGQRIPSSIDGKVLYSRLDGQPATGVDLNAVDAYVSALVSEGGCEQAAAAKKLKDKSIVISNIKRNEAWDTLRKRMDGQRPRTKNRITSSERRRLGLYDLRDANLTYEAMLPLHDMWLQYFTAGVLDGSRNHDLVLARALKVLGGLAMPRQRCFRLRTNPPPGRFPRRSLVCGTGSIAAARGHRRHCGHGN
jgi:hypothetical protein